MEREGGEGGQAPGQFKVMAGAGPEPPKRGKLIWRRPSAQQDDDKVVVHACVTNTVQAKITQEGNHTCPAQAQETHCTNDHTKHLARGKSKS
eukprot:1588947-Amphidinium_carterae.1